MNNPNNKILTIGGSGLVGSRITELLGETYEFQNLSTQTGVDITKSQTLNVLEKDTNSKIVLLLASKTDVDACEKDKDLGEAGEAYKINVTGVQNIVNAIKSSNKKLIYISTDFVFDGINPPDRGYTEEDTPHPVNWYGDTKYQGEEIIKNSNVPYLIIRISHPYRKQFAKKKDFARAILSRLQNNQPIAAVTDHIITPTFIDDIAMAIDVLIKENKEGIYHVIGSQSLTPYDAAILIATQFNLNKSLITKTTRTQFFKDRAPRPFNLTINNGKIRRLGIQMKTFEEGLSLL